MDTIGFIGAGNMGFALISGLAKSGMKDEIIFTDKNLDREIYVVEQLEVKPISTNQEVVKSAKYIVLAVKPQMLKEVIDDIKDSVTKENIIISLAPTSINNLKKLIGNDIKIVRAMPNTPALVGEGMSVLSFSDDDFSDEERETILSIFVSCGKCEVMDESYLNAVISVSGSSPAYVYMFIEAMADAAVRYGIQRSMAYELAAQSVMGAAKMILETNEHPAVLKDNVCSPAGTTIEAVAVLEKDGFRNAVIEAMDACYKKSKQISENNI